jgi:hypothetical protein
MGLEVFTGKISDLVITNPPGTDPKSQGDDHIRGIKKTMVMDCLGKAEGGTLLAELAIEAGTGSRLRFNPGEGAGFAGDIGAGIYTGRTDSLGLASGPGGLHMGTPAGEAFSIDAAGFVDFPLMGKTLAPYGYQRFPGGFIMQWGEVAEATGNAGVSFPFPFPNAVFGMQVTGSNGGLLDANEMVTASYNSLSNSGCQISVRYYKADTGVVPSIWPMRWIAYGW